MNQLHDEYQIRLIKLGNIATHFTGSFAAGDAIGMTKQFLNRGAQALLVVGGPQSVDAAQEIKNQNSNCILIGVDTSMEDSDYQRLHAGCTTGEYNKDDP
ncbi:MAG: hypothetical protein MJ219_01895 [Mycoplasmoidaceae bacterium]|nr:hypothetical protein [Mycoplasmoidaceae bacterium]